MSSGETPSRREFITVSSAALALATVGQRADAQRAIERRLAATESPAARDVAMAAVQAARDAGASYADVRVDAEVGQSVSVWQHHAAGSVSYTDRFVYGVRVIANGAWGFAGDEEGTADAAASCARRAVEQARANAALRRIPVVLVPAPVVTNGRWETPIVVDPFAVSPGDQQELLLEAVRAALGVKGIRSAGGAFSFSRTVRTFASTEGSFIVQTLWYASPFVETQAALSDRLAVSRSVRGLRSAAAGYEIVRDGRLNDGAREAAERAVEGVQMLARARTVDVGRYDVVVSAGVMAGLSAGTLGQATGWNRVAGRDVSYEGTSFAAPPERVLGTLIASPLVTLTGDRALKGGLGTVAWDDEGVAADAFPLIERGVLTDYQTTRESAGALAWWYQRMGRPVRSHGCAAGGGLAMPREAMPNLIMQPARATGAGVSDLIAGVERGLLFAEDASGGTDDTVGTGKWWTSVAQEIRNGKLMGAVRDAGMQFRTRELWMSLDAIGGATSAESVGAGGATVRAVPGRFRGVSIVNSGLVV